MALDMNIDVGSLIKGLFSKKGSKGGAKTASSPHTKTALAIVIVFALIGAYIYFVYLPTQQDLRIKNEKISQIDMIRVEIKSLSSEIEEAQNKLTLAQKEYDRRTNLFHTDKELEDLYGQISLLAMQNQLMITKIEKGVERPIFAEGSCSNDSNEDNFNDGDEFVDEEEFFDEEQTQLQKVGYYEFVVNLAISGNYSKYTNFRNGLAQLKKIININKETIVVESESKNGNVTITSAIATYRLPKDESEQCGDPNQELDYEN
tara:strand:+ start:77 stop:859 length:783 start_codon:yes stop_codon:yes gene_type:complete